MSGTPWPTGWRGGDASEIFSFGVIAVGGALLGWLLWQSQHELLARAAMGLLHGEMRLAHFFTNRFDLADSQLLAANPATVSAGRLVRLARAIGLFVLYPALAIVAGLGWACFLRAPPARFRRTFDLESLMREQARAFKAPSAFVGRRLGLTLPRKGAPRPLDPALSVREWAERFALDESGRLDEARARAALVRQLGRRWRGIEDAEPCVRCLLAAFALHGLGRREEALKFFGALSQSLRGGKGEGRKGPEGPLALPRAAAVRADWLLASLELRNAVVPIMERHAFATPGLMSVLVWARENGGVLPPAQFACLKLVSRELWYALHSLGFPAEGGAPRLHPNPRAEAIGARDHWAAECAAGAPLISPCLDRAIAAIGLGPCAGSVESPLCDCAAGHED